MKKHYLLALCMILLCSACSQNTKEDNDNLNTQIIQQDDKKIDELISLASGSYVLSSSSNLDNPLETAKIVISNDYTVFISYKEVDKEAISYSTKFTPTFADSQYDLTGKEIQLDFEDEGIFPFSKGNYFYLRYTSDYEFSITVQSWGVKKDGSGYMRAKFVKEN